MLLTLLDAMQGCMVVLTLSYSERQVHSLVFYITL